MLGMSRMCCEDSVRRGIARLDEQEAEQWLRRNLGHVVRPLPQELSILDIDTTVKPMYGR